MSSALNDRVRIEHRAVTSRSGTGADVYSWSHFATRWAKFEPLRGAELVAAQQMQAETIARFRMHYDPTILEEMRIVFRGVAYDIQSIIDPGGRREELEIMTKAGATNG